MESNKTYATLATGKEINAVINHEMYSFERSDISPYDIIKDPDLKNIVHISESDIYDISEAHDGSIVTWYDAEIKSQEIYSAADVIYFNNDCSNMVAGCTHLMATSSIFYDKSNDVCVKYVENMNDIFAGCAYSKTLLFTFMLKNAIANAINEGKFDATIVAGLI